MIPHARSTFPEVGSSFPPAPLRLSPLLLLLPVVLTAGACKVDKDAFESRIFKCDTTAPDPLCGTDENGEQMTCFAARQIGGTDFCTKWCPEPMSLPDGDVCVQGNAQLKFCKPDDDANADGTHPLGACDRSDLGCLRTDVTNLDGEGVCITGSPCLTNGDCKDPVRSTCAATFLQELYAGQPPIKADHLYCLQEGCVSGDTACSPGETCLPKVIPAAANPPDICVPNCDSHGRCPPNHFCLATVSGPANPKVCIPGLLGFVCKSDIDCLVGKCQSDEDPTPEKGLSLCTVPCASDDDCAKFDSHQGRFICSPGGTNRHCITPDAYTGALCRTTADCIRDVDTVCAKQSPTDATGTCLRQCDATALATDPTKTCAPRGRIGQTCLPFVGDDGKAAYTCFPGFFPYPCFTDAQCAVPDLKCAGVDLSDPANPKPGNCTHLCASDADCQNDKWTQGSYCGAPDVPVCLPLIEDGQPCQAAKQCASGSCAVPPGSGMTAKTCGGK